MSHSIGPARRPGRPGRGAGFTLVELTIVILLLGIIAGIGLAGIDRMDPGARGLRDSLQTFLETSRDRARATGHPVEVRIEPGPSADEAPLVRRYVFRPVLEASFENAFERGHGLEFLAPAEGGIAGRFGAGLDLREGGGVHVTGRGGTPPVSSGMSIELDVYNESGDAGTLIEWKDLFTLKVQRNGTLHAQLRAGQPGERPVAIDVRSPAEKIVPGRWHHVRFRAAGDVVELSVDGEPCGKELLQGVLAKPSAAPFLGDPGGVFRGRLDEFTVWARVPETGPTFREDVGALFATPSIVFDRNGLLDAAAHPLPVAVEIREHGTVRSSFFVGRFSLEVDTTEESS